MKKTYLSKIVASIVLTAGLQTYMMADELTTSTITDNNPRLYFDDTRFAGDPDAYFGMYRLSDTSSGMYMNIENVGTILQWTESNNNFYFHNGVMQFRTNTGNVFISNSSGDISLADGSVFIDKSENAMGIGTTVPDEDIHVVNTTTAIKGSPPFTTTYGDASIQLDAYDDTSWSIGARYSKLALLLNASKTFGIADNSTGNRPFVIEEAAPTNSVFVDSTGYVGMGTSSPDAQLEVRFSGPNTVDDGLSVLTLLSANNSEADKASDAGFALKNTREDFQWNFRTLEYNDAFTATKSGTGGGEFLVQSPTTDFRDAIVKVAGVTIFEDGHLVTASSRELKTDIQPLDSEAALEAFDKLQPVSYAYKGHKDDAVVGFIAEDVPELVAMPSKKSIDSTEIVAVLTSVLAETRAEMEANVEDMKAKIESMEANAEAMRTEIAELKGMK